MICGEEQAIPRCPGSAASASHTLQERRNSPGCINLNHPVQIADVEPQLQGTSGDDHAVLPLGEGLFRLSAGIDTE